MNADFGKFKINFENTALAGCLRWWDLIIGDESHEVHGKKGGGEFPYFSLNNLNSTIIKAYFLNFSIIFIMFLYLLILNLLIHCNSKFVFPFLSFLFQMSSTWLIRHMLPYSINEICYQFGTIQEICLACSRG